MTARTAQQAQLWLQSWPARLTPLVDLICIPGAGAGASRFNPWQGHLPPYCGVHVAQLPGRENRIEEVPIDALEIVVQQLSAAFEPIHRRRPVVLFGHSMGAVLAYELAVKLSQDGRPPDLLVMSATTPPSGQVNRPAADTEELKQLLLAFDADNQSVVNNPELFASLEPALRADFQLLRRHRVTPKVGGLKVKTILLSGSSDPVVSSNAIALWGEYLAGEVNQREMSGGHQFPFSESLQPVTQLLTEELQFLVQQQMAK